MSLYFRISLFGSDIGERPVRVFCCSLFKVNGESLFFRLWLVLNNQLILLVVFEYEIFGLSYASFAASTIAEDDIGWFNGSFELQFIYRILLAVDFSFGIDKAHFSSCPCTKLLNLF